jgi:hypothetical protein
MTTLTWWMRIVGIFYVFLFVAAAILHLPIQAEGPEGIMQRAASGDPVSRFVVGTWVVLGLMLGAVGLALLAASRFPAKATVLVWTVIGNELIWGIGSDLYKLARGYPLHLSGPWIIVHAVIILTGILAINLAQIPTM